MDKKIIDLEIRIAFLEDLIDKLNNIVSNLNQEVLEQKRISELLRAELQNLRNSQKADYSGSSEIPPHY